MAISKDQKHAIVARVKDILADSKSVVFVNFHKLPVSESTTIRRELRSKDVQFTVAKKTLTKRALADASVTGEMPSLEGELALVYSADLLAPAREIYEFQKKFADRVSILGGVFNGEYKNKTEMESIANIPSQKTLYAQFVNVINSPIQGIVMALNGIAEKKQ
ncbi:MAG TPA: 50S ribosomal protein L10 [Candidatus Paceibacterota bacterium]